MAFNVDKCDLLNMNIRAEFIRKIKQSLLTISNLKSLSQAAFLNIVHLATPLARMKTALMFRPYIIICEMTCPDKWFQLNIYLPLKYIED